jgi:hypothetical protein
VRTSGAKPAHEHGRPEVRPPARPGYGGGNHDSSARTSGAKPAHEHGRPEVRPPGGGPARLRGPWMAAKPEFRTRPC